MIKVLIPIGDAAEAMDTLYPFFRIREDGYQAVVAGPEKRVYPLVMHEIPPGWDITRESPSYHLAAEIVDKWLSTKFEGGRHARRVNKIDEDNTESTGQGDGDAAS